MSFHEAQKQLAVAGRDALARIARDRLMAAPRLAGLLAYIGEHLFDPNLSVAGMKRACRVRDNSISTAFRREIGQSPRDYIAARRLETATTLLRDTDLEIWLLAETLGYSSLQVFSRAFANWRGERPSVYRARFKQSTSTRPPVKRLASSSGEHAGEPRQTIPRQDPPRPATPRAYPMAVAPPPTRSTLCDDRVGTLIRDDRIHELRAEAIWEVIRARPVNEQRALVATTTSKSPALFHLLRHKSREEGRDNRRIGVHFAELALAALEATEHREEDESWLALKAQGWAWVGNARTLAVDFSGAAEAFAIARRWLPTADRVPEIYAELCYIESVSYTYQGHFEKAFEQIEQGFAHSARSDQKPFQTEMLIQRGLLHIDSGRPEAGVLDLERAVDLLDDRAEPYLRLSACHNLALGLAGLGRLDQAASQLREAHELSLELGNKNLYCHVLWVEGLIAYGRGDLPRSIARLSETHQGFLELEEPAYAGVSALDLAMAHLEARNLAAASVKAAEAAGLLERLGLRREALAALRVQTQAIEDRHATLVLWREIRARLATSKQVAAPIVRR